MALDCQALRNDCRRIIDRDRAVMAGPVQASQFPRPKDFGTPGTGILQSIRAILRFEPKFAKQADCPQQILWNRLSLYKIWSKRIHSDSARN